MSYRVTFEKMDDGQMRVLYTGNVNLYEFAELLRIECRKLEEQLIAGITT